MALQGDKKIKIFLTENGKIDYPIAEKEYKKSTKKAPCYETL